MLERSLLGCRSRTLDFGFSGEADAKFLSETRACMELSGLGCQKKGREFADVTLMSPTDGKLFMSLIKADLFMLHKKKTQKKQFRW